MEGQGIERTARFARVGPGRRRPTAPEVAGHPRTILLPVEEVGGSIEAVRLVADLATAQGSRVVVMGLGADDRSASGFVDGIVSSLQAMGVAASGMRPAMTGSLHETVAAAACELAADLVVVGAAGRSMQVGTVLWSVNRECPPACNLLVLPGVGREGLPHGGLLLAVHRSPGSLAAERVALRLATARESAVRVFHVREALSGDAVDYHLESVVQAQRLVEAVAERFREAGLTAETCVAMRPGHVAGRIAAAAEEFDAGLVVAGARGQYRWDAWLDSVAHDLVHRSRRPVLLVRQGG
jgi:nucleotide-binding universal stress UspA family protein